MMLKKLTLILFSIIIVSIVRAQSPYVNASEIYYQKIGQSTYKITAIVYRNCASDALYNLNGFVISDTFRIAMNLKRISIEKIDDTCGNPCQNKNAQGNLGFEKHVFYDTINFKTTQYDSILNAGLCEVRFAIHHQLRNPGITNHNTHSNWLYNDAMVNICIGYTNIQSPIFSFEPKMITACNQYFSYTPGAIDTFDFDSLGFELDTVKYDYSKNVTYTGSYTSSLPMTPYCPPTPGTLNCRALSNAKPPRGVFFNKELCQFIVTPTNCDEIASVVFKISEYRRDSTGIMKLIGYVRRDMTIIVKKMSDNNSPYLTGQTYFNICDLTKLCFNSQVDDDTYLPNQIKDTVNVTFNYGIPDLDFKIIDSSSADKSLSFCLNMKPQYINKRLFFGIKAMDKLCNANFNSFNYYIHVRSKTSYKPFHAKRTCGNILFGALPDDSTEILKGIIRVSYKNKIIYTTTNVIDSLTVWDNGTYYITYVLNSLSSPNCNVTIIDTIQINNAVTKAFLFALPDTSVCSSYPASLIFNPSKHTDLSSFEWSRNDSIINISDSIINSEIYFKSHYKLKLLYSNGCVSESERTFSPYKNITDILPSIIWTCDSPIYILKPNINTLKQPIVYQWQYRIIDTSSSKSLNFYPKNNEKIFLRLEDENHCQLNDSVSFVVNSLPSFYMEKKMYYHTICENGMVVITTNNYIAKAPYTINWKLNGIDSANFKNKTNFRFYLKNNANVKAILTDSNGCIASDSLYFKAPEYPIISIVDTGNHCAGKPFLISSKILNSSYNEPEYTWYVDDVLENTNPKDSIRWFSITKNFKLQVKFFGLYGCSVDTTVNIKVNPQPDFMLLGDTLFHISNLIKFRLNKTFKSYMWSNGDTSAATDFWAYQIGNPGKFSISCYVTDSFGCFNTKSIAFRTDAYSNIENTKLYRIYHYPNPFEDILKVYSDTESHYRILSLDGKVIQEGEFIIGEQLLHLNELSNGIYFLETEGKMYKIVKV